MNQTLVVVDDAALATHFDSFNVLTFDQYLAQYPKKNEAKTRVINLCDTTHYLSRGYYCSLLAEARNHRVIPTVESINGLRTPESIESKSDGCWIFFGHCTDPARQKQARQHYDSFPAPIIRLDASIRRASLAELSPAERVTFTEQLHQFTDKVWRHPKKARRLRWDMAILIDPDEQDPPSNPKALKQFVKAAAKLGIHAELLRADELGQINQYDALFIRATTAIENETYAIAQQAKQAGVVVIDDPESILRCCNKVFLHDAFSYQGVPAPATQVVSSTDAQLIDELEDQIGYPMIVKLPEGSFSRGVYKCEDRSELVARLNEMLATSALALVQEYLYTDFDWRIGVLAGKPIYACRYHMAKGHWQIYNHADQHENVGLSETLATFEVPKKVLDAAIRSTKLIGNGFYGVDIKQKDSSVYVIEVNDNPSIDEGVEDAYLGPELYMAIMAEFANRLEARGKL